MFRKLKDSLFWKTQFDAEWQAASTFFGFIKFYYREQDLKEKKYLWREEKGSRLSPRLAVFRAYEEFCNDFYKRNVGRPGSEFQFMELAYALQYAAPYLDEAGNYQERTSALDDRWKNYYLAENEQREIKHKRKKENAEELQSHRFDLEVIDRKWNSMISDGIPDVATRIWNQSFPRKSAVEIADSAGVSIRDFVLWMCVFKRHLKYREEVISGVHMYSRQQTEHSLQLAINSKSG
jgi:hypothetical protein